MADKKKNVKFAYEKPGDNGQHASVGDKYRSQKNYSHDGY
jgi:hypothetical protein